MSHPTVEQLHAFHAQDREIFSKLVLKFLRPPAESLLVMATWLWLEDFGFGNIFSIITVFSDLLIVDLANEAVLCFQCLESDQPPNDVNQIPLTERFMKNDISLQILHKHRYTAITGIKNFLTTICSRIFSDILQRVLPPSSCSFVTKLRHPLIIPGFPHPTFGSINVLPDIVARDNLINTNLFLFPHGLWGWNATYVTTDKERTVFLTFSRGFPVSQAEVYHLFTEIYGENCVESVYMQEEGGSSSNENTNCNGQQQPLYAKMVLDSVVTVDRILNGEEKKKYRINGKHIWARKFKNNKDGLI
ncbi:hypothetical protein ISN44_As07g011350 [Arabidopsis suecica]|uniref:Uncharacterized protein n=1 Tax=Arabidopsis suecica TaxID=45249 RepID=A0A8T2BV56_ARASU|nr:hypothetical protein ISN44_As07g011350 [Arabidopsis suecica]